MAQRKPTVGGDSGNWGEILNDYLGVSLNDDGTINPNTVSDTQIASDAAIDPTKINGTVEVQSNKNQPGGYAPLDSNSKVPTTNMPLPTGTASGDLSGSYPNPTVAKVNGVSITSTPSTGQVLMASNSTAATWNSQSVSGVPTVINVMDYGAKGDGSTDDYDAIQNAITACGTTGGIIYFPPGKTYYLNKASAGGLKLPVSNTQWLIFSGYGATVALSSNVPRFLDFNRSANDQDFDYFAVEGMTIDAGINVKTPSTNHIVIGGSQNAAQLQRVNIRHIRVKDVRTINVPVDKGNSSRVGILIDGYQYAGTTTSNYINDIIVDNYRQEGGECPVSVTAGCYVSTRTITNISADTAANVTVSTAHGLETGDYVSISGSNSTPSIDGTQRITVTSTTAFTVPITTTGTGNAGTVSMGSGIYPTPCHYEANNIHISHIWWDTGITDCSLAVPTCGIQVGGAARGGVVRINDCYLKGSGDNIIEIDGFRDVVVENVCAVDAASGAFYFRNMNTPLGIDKTDLQTYDRQRIVYQNCTYGQVNTGYAGKIFWMGSSGSPADPVPTGHVLVQGCRDSSSLSDSTGPAIVMADTATAVQSLTIRNCTFFKENYVSGSISYPAFLYARGCGTVQGTPTPVAFENNYCYFSGDDTNGNILRPIWGLGNCRLNIKNNYFELKWVNGTGSCIRVFDIGTTTPMNTMDGVISGNVIRGSLDAGNIYINYFGDAPTRLTVPSKLVIENNDWSNFTGGSLIDLAYYTTDAINPGKVRFRNNTYRTVPAGATLTLPVSKTITAISIAAAAQITIATHGYVTGDIVYISGTDSTPVVTPGFYPITYVDTNNFTIPFTTTGTGTTGTAVRAYQNRDAYDEDIVINGGTGTLLQVSTDAGVSWNTVLSQASAAFPYTAVRLAGGDFLSVTSTVAASARKVPRP